MEILRADGERLALAAARAGPDAAVPACPGWRIHDLVRHVGGVHRWAAGHVATGRRDPMPAEQERELFASPADDELLDWLRDGHRHVVRALAGADPDLRCWTFLPGPSPLAFWARRQAHETAIHHADAEAASGTVPQWSPEFAADGIDELLGRLLPGRRERITADPLVRIDLRAADAEAAWSIQIGPDGC